MANPDPQNARPEGRSYLELWCCLLVFIEENRENNKLLIFIELFFLIGHSWCPHVRTQLVSACVWTWDTASPIQKEIQEIDRKASKEHEEAKEE